MLWTPGNQFGFTVDNIADTYSDTGIGTNVVSNASAHTKGANTNILNGLAEDCYGLAIGFSRANSPAATRRNLCDILIDPAAGVGNSGSSWSIVIANLYCAYASLGCGGYWYYFPLYLKAGTAIGGSQQSSNTTANLQVTLKAFGKPSRPELLKVGTKVQTYGAVTGTTSGTNISPGTNAKGVYTASLGTSSYDQFWWQGGLGYADSSIGGGASTSEASFLDVAVSNDAGTTKYIAAADIKANFSANEQGGKEAFGHTPPFWFLPSGGTVYMRAASTVVANTTPTAIAYGLGG